MGNPVQVSGTDVVASARNHRSMVLSFQLSDTRKCKYNDKLVLEFTMSM